MNGFRVIIDRSRMYVKIISGNDLVDAVQSEDELMVYLAAHKITRGILTRVILRAFIELPDLEEPTEYVVVLGKKPVHGKDGTIDFKINISEKAQYFAPTMDDDDLPVDYKSAIGLPVVSSGECICEVIKPEKGVDGYTIDGKFLPGKDGKEVSLMVGEGAKLNIETNQVYAVMDGRPVYADNKISVSAIYEVKGDVCYKTGNIVFNGHVIIRGGVQDTFSIDAKSVEIKGCVGDAFIKAKDELVVYGGVIGKQNEHPNSGYIKCQGNVLAKYFNDVNVEVDGNLTVRKEIVNSNVKCAGRIKASCIIGGVTTAFKGIEASVIGSEMGVPTHIETGISYKVKYYEDALAGLSWQIDSLLEPLKHLFDNEAAFRNATKMQQRRFIAEYDNFKGIVDGYLKIIDLRLEQIEREKNQAVCEVIVMKHLYSDIVLFTPNCMKKFINEFKGPLRLEENIRNKSIHISSYSHEGKSILPRDLKRENRHAQQYQYLNMDKIKLLNSNKTVYTHRGISDLDRKFYRTINGQNFCVCVFEDRHTKRLILENCLKKAGIANVYGIKDVFEALEIVKELEDRNLVVICNLHVGTKHGLKFVSNLLHKAPNNYGIFLVDKINSGLQEAVSRIDCLAMFKEDVAGEAIVQQIRDFGFEF